MKLTKIEENIFLSGSLDKSIKMWDALSGTCIYTFLGHQGNKKRL